MPNPLDVVLGNILGSEQTRPDQKAVSFRIDFKNYVKLSALQSIANVLNVFTTVSSGKDKNNIRQGASLEGDSPHEHGETL